MHREPGRDHPRLRGEHAGTIGSDLTGGGSSPPARGALNRIVLSLGLSGIIPACAGSTPG